ncbi:nitroreductase family protein [Leptothrix discophora]|uniref:Nitroreductase family protein n=1 Tax=Leptothrix discophora TaxID=89 RepID=A0ABT9G7C0_LEPDI|nr:nitroreductase family protein [Leptothrix discophora]MDP4302377.1 nitroreductase family protein [Leptothrix discophora]
MPPSHMPMPPHDPSLDPSLDPESGPPTAPRRHAGELFEHAQTLISTRRNTSPKRLHEPGPDAAQLHALLALAADAPDHAELTPWRFVLVPTAQRHRLAEAFAQALLARDPQAGPVALADARDKAHRAPLLLLAIARLGPITRDGVLRDIPAAERLVSLGAAIQNLLLGAHAMGYASGLTSGQAMDSAPLRALFALAEGEQAVCCINLGTARQSRPRARPRPLPDEFAAVLPEQGAPQPWLRPT